MLPWILGGVVGATITAVVLYNEEEKEKALIAQEDAEAEKKFKETVQSFDNQQKDEISSPSPFAWALQTKKF